MVAKKKHQTETSLLSRTFEEESTLEIVGGSNDDDKEQDDESSQRVVVTPTKVSAGSNANEVLVVDQSRKQVEELKSRNAELESMLQWAASKRLPPAESPEEEKFWKEEY